MVLLVDVTLPCNIANLKFVQMFHKQSSCELVLILIWYLINLVSFQTVFETFDFINILSSSWELFKNQNLVESTNG